MKGEVSFHCTGQSALGELLNLQAVSQGRGKSWMLGSPRGSGTSRAGSSRAPLAK